MILLFVDSKHEYFKELIGEHCFFNFDKDGRILLHFFKSEKYIKLKKSGDLVYSGRYAVLRDRDSIFILKDMNNNSNLEGE